MIQRFTWTRYPGKKTTDAGPDVSGAYKVFHPSGRIAALVCDSGSAYVWPLDDEESFSVKLSRGFPRKNIRIAESILRGHIAIA